METILKEWTPLLFGLEMHFRGKISGRAFSTFVV